MCRSIKSLANLTPPANGEEIRAAALQFVRKIGGTNKPSKANQAAFESAVEEIALSAERLLASLETKSAPRTREALAVQAAKRSRRGSSLGNRAE